MTVSDLTRNDVWEMMLDLERQVRYYGTLADRYGLRYRTIRYLLLLGVLAEGGIFHLFSSSPWLLLGIGGMVALALGFVTVFDAVTNYAETSASLRTTSLLCDDLKAEAERLWRDIEANRIDDDGAEALYSKLMDRWIRWTQRVTLELHHHDNVKAAKEAYEVVASHYAQ